MSLLASRLAPRIVEEDGAFRTRVLTIAAGMTDVIALGRGDPDFHTPAHIVAAAKAEMDAYHHHYTGPTGLPALRAAIAADLQAAHGLDYGADEKGHCNRATTIQDPTPNIWRVLPRSRAGDRRGD